MTIQSPRTVSKTPHHARSMTPGGFVVAGSGAVAQYEDGRRPKPCIQTLSDYLI